MTVLVLVSSPLARFLEAGQERRSSAGGAAGLKSISSGGLLLFTLPAGRTAGGWSPPGPLTSHTRGAPPDAPSAGSAERPRRRRTARRPHGHRRPSANQVLIL
jgi:hypothetical protein